MNDLVRWNDFHDVFVERYPGTIRDVMDNEINATVLFNGYYFQIRPRPDGRDFDIYGPAFLLPEVSA